MSEYRDPTNEELGNTSETGHMMGDEIERVTNLARAHLCDWCLKGSPAGYDITDGESDGVLYHRVDDMPVRCDATGFLTALEENNQ